MDDEDDTASEGVEVIVIEDEDFKEMFSGTVEGEKIEHCRSRVSLQDHGYNKTREIIQVKQINFRDRNIYTQGIYDDLLIDQ